MSPAPWNNEPLPPHLQTDPVLEVGYNKNGDLITSIPTRPHPLTHTSVDAPICLECQALELTFFDPTCSGCRCELQSPATDIAHVFAALRQWVPQVQTNIEFLVDEALRRGAHPDDRDCLTDMTLLMYACKAGANGVGDVHAAARVAHKLIEMGADLDQRCKWTNMSALHYASFFDAAPVLNHLLMKSKGRDVDSVSSEYENGAALHIASANLGISAAEVLLKFGADKNLKDDLARTPLDCIPDEEDFSLIPNVEELIQKMTKLLTDDPVGNSEAVSVDTPNHKQVGAVSGRTALKALNLNVGDRVIVNNSNIGTLRFCGTTGFSAGIWAGIELDEPEGRNNGSVNGVTYFTCQPNYGVFVQANKIAKVGRNYKEDVKPVARNNIINHGKVNTKHVTSRLNDRLNLIEEKSEIKVGDRVQVKQYGNVPDQDIQMGHVRFIGKVDFVADDGKWYGIELDERVGRHDGTVQGVRYFAAAPNAGIFVTENKLTKVLENNLDVNKQGRISAMSNVSIPKPAVRRSLSMKHKEEQATSKSPAPSMTSEQPRVRSRLGQSPKVPPVIEKKEGGWKTVSAVQFNKFKKKVEKKYLEPGTSVICIQTKEMAVVKYVGRVDFAPGIWVGLELRDAKGNHDGFVKEKRYFQCKQNHGLMTKPHKISVHGITGDKLLKPESEYTF